jgi:hypothetical protein
MNPIGATSFVKNSFFFSPSPALGHLSARRAGGRRRPIFLGENQLGPDARLTSVAVEGKKPPPARDPVDDFVGHYPAQCQERATQMPTALQTARTFWNTVEFRATLLATKSFFQGDSCGNVGFPLRFLRPCHVCATIKAATSVLKRVSGAILCQNGKTCAGPSRDQTAHRR